MRRGLLALCFVASMMLAGCFGPSSASWGDGSSSVDVDFTTTSAEVKSTLSGSPTVISDLIPVGCDPTTEAPKGGNSLIQEGAPVTFTGYLAASQFYTEHNTIMGARGLDFGVTTAVAIQSMSFNQAAEVTDGEGARIDVKEWVVPLTPETGAGSVDIDDLDSDSDTEWYVLGLVPSSESILYGFMALDEWHQAVSIEGYLVDAGGDGAVTYGYNSTWHRTRDDCSMMIGDVNRADAYVFVTGITLETATVSQSGEAKDEWVQGDMPFLGRSGFVMFFLVFGIGGSVGAFIFSQQLVMKSAKNTMKTLIGDEGMKKAASVKAEAKAAKKAGMESPTERQARLDKQRKAEEKKTPKSQPERESKKEKGDALGGFDLDSVLATTGIPSQSKSGPSARKSSVVVTDAAQEMDRMNVQDNATSSVPSSVPNVSSAPSVSSSPSSTARSPPTTEKVAERKPPVKRRRAVKKAPESKPVAEPEPQARPRETFEEEDDFSDFSF